MDPRRLAMQRVLVVVLATLALGYALALARLVVANQRALVAEAGLDVDVARLEADVAALATAVTDSGSEEAAERWAREHQRLAREGDHVIVPVQPTSGPAGGGQGAEAATDGAWQRLLRWLRDG